MTKFEIYSLILCMVVFVLLVGVFSFMLSIIIKQGLKHIKAGLEDEEIIKEFDNGTKKKGKFSKVLDTIVNSLICLFFGVIFLSSLYINCTQNVYFDNVPTYRVVLTSSMESKNKSNKYLFDNNINNQIGSFDLIATYKIPKEEDLKLYDIVLYEVDGILVVHRIVGIEEPNAQHPNERHFLLQGDAVSSPDRFPVRYSQMKGIYKNEKIPFVGSFVLFMQSPAGWICILLVVVSMIGTPILENKLLKKRKERYLLITNTDETATTEIIEESVDLDNQNIRVRFANFGPTKTFYQRLENTSEQMQNRYIAVKETLCRIDGVRVIEGKTMHSYKHKSICIARLFIRGKTLNVCLGLNPKEYKNSKYIFTDLSDKEKYKNYPMCLKLSSDRQTRWANELILELAKNNGLVILGKPVIATAINSNFENLKENREKKTFNQKLELSPLAKQRFDILTQLLNRISGIRVVEGKYSITYKVKNTPIVKFVVKGKTLNAYLGLNPSEYNDTKYIFTDASETKKYSNYPMRVKVSSDRQVKWTKELILDKADKNGLVLMPEKEQGVSFKALKNKKTFKQKLKLSPLAKERFNDLKGFIKAIDNIRLVEGKYSITYKVKSKPIVKFVIKGKTLNAYLGLNPDEYQDTKYVFTNVSNVKKYFNYPMRVKVSSNRQVKWVKELIQEILQK